MRPLTRFLTLLTLLMTLMLSQTSLLPAQAAGKFYTQQVFVTLNAEGKTIVVHVHADWCGICKAQDVEVNAAMRSPAFQEVVFFEVNFDSQRKAVKFFHSKVQSVLIIFKQGKEIDRAIGIRDPGELQTFLRQALP